jgi:hypothetical protein
MVGNLPPSGGGKWAGFALIFILAFKRTRGAMGFPPWNLTHQSNPSRLPWRLHRTKGVVCVRHSRPHIFLLNVDGAIARAFGFKSAEFKAEFANSALPELGALKLSVAAESRTGRPMGSQTGTVPEVGVGGQVILSRHPPTTPRSRFHKFCRQLIPF